MGQTHAAGCQFVAYPETALTTFFPRWYMEEQVEVDAYFEKEMPNANCQPLFELAKELKVGSYLGYAELMHESGGIHRYNTSSRCHRHCE